MSEPFIGQIIMFAGNFAPRGWAFCNGQLLAISDHLDLFAVLGTTYGGDGRTTFALPDLRGRVAMNGGSGPGLTLRNLGEKGGAETHVLSEAQLPAHGHTGSGVVNATADPANTSDPSGNSLALAPAYTTQPPNVKMADGTVTVTVDDTGSSQPVGHLPPYTVVHYIIALEGITPGR